jgi:hypothetical protein
MGVASWAAAGVGSVAARGTRMGAATRAPFQGRVEEGKGAGGAAGRSEVKTPLPRVRLSRARQVRAHLLLQRRPAGWRSLQKGCQTGPVDPVTWQDTSRVGDRKRCRQCIILPGVRALKMPDCVRLTSSGSTLEEVLDPCNSGSLCRKSSCKVTM